MNRLRELLDSNMRSIPELVPAMRDLYSYGPSAMCFWLGDENDPDFVTGLVGLKDLIRLPYECCWFEMACSGRDGIQKIVGALSFNRPEGNRTIFFQRSRGNWMLCCVADSEHINSEKLCVTPAISESKNLARTVLDVIGIFLTALHCKNVQRTETKPSAKLQRARVKKGKQPLFSYWTLHLTGPNARGVPLGGTHASPRLHLRKGHPRQYADGSAIWIDPTMVGNKSLGMVHKDYSTTPQLMARLRGLQAGALTKSPITDKNHEPCSKN